MLSFDSYGPPTAATPVLLLHGFPLSRQVWTDAAQLLSRHRRVITADLLGFGESKSSEQWTMESQARAVHALATHLNLGTFALAGLSMGGYVSLAYHRLFPDTLKALILIDTKSAADTDEAKETRTRMADIALREGSQKIAQMMFPKMLAPNALQPIQDKLLSIMTACPSETIATACLAMRARPDYTADLAASKTPIQIITGHHDAITPPDPSRALAAQCHGTYTEIPHAGHMSPLEKPAEVAAAIEAFVASLSH